MTATRILLGLGLSYALHFSASDFGHHLGAMFDGIAHAISMGAF
jgi:hypothetical protein